MTESEDLRRCEEQLSIALALIDTTGDGIICTDADGKIEFVNEAAIALLGYGSRREVEGLNGWDMMPERYREDFACILNRTAEVVGIRRDGSEFPMEASARALNIGDRVLYAVTMRDITDRKKIDKRVSEFYSIVSHELRSPLASIRGSLGLIEGGAIGEVSDDVGELIQIAKRNCDRLIRLINDILDAKKIEAGKMNVRKLPLRADDLLSSAIEVMQSLATESAIELRTSHSAPREVLGDHDRVVQVLTNFLSNAIKHSPEGEVVDVFVKDSESNPEEYLRFCVRDRGSGIPSEQVYMLFSEFQQIDSSDSRKIGGTGLGLAISKSIVELLDGQIGVDNAPGQGATFWFDLPLNKM